MWFAMWPRYIGPRTSHESRAGSDSRIHAPLRVPSRSVEAVIVRGSPVAGSIATPPPTTYRGVPAKRRRSTFGGFAMTATQDTAEGLDAFVGLAAELGAQFAPYAAQHDRDGTFVDEAFTVLRESGYL